MLAMAKRLRSAFGSLGGKVALKTRIAVSFSYSAAASVLSSVFPIDPSVNTAEWTAFGALFDQYRVRRCQLQFWLPQIVNGSSPFGCVSCVRSDGFDRTHQCS